MKALIQRVSFARMETVGQTEQIEGGFLVLLGVAVGDTPQKAELLAKKTAQLRLFEDENGRMNRSLHETDGQVLVVPNFTLYADCRSGRRPSFTAAARPEQAESLFEHFKSRLTKEGIPVVKSGVFQADMAITLCNDGPVTVILDTADWEP